MESKFNDVVVKDLDKESGVIIPIETAIGRFFDHLSYNDRTIFSARFGGGKTFFLNEFFIKYSDEFEVIKLFPVNYQVEDNKDIFELIKRDILLHLLANDQIENDNIIDEFICNQYYLFNNGADILLDLLSVIPNIKIPAQIMQKALKHFKDYKDFKVQTQKQNIDIAEEYVLKFQSITGSNEYDSISFLITKCIQKIKERGKKVVLLIEDLDRVDPAHLFRILNVLTAHIDRNHILVHEFESKQFRNKFDFDNIITVFDYSNTKKIYHHFYGTDTSFEGYINKFINSDHIEYTITSVAVEYVVQWLSKCLKIPTEFFLKNSEIKSRINLLSIRDIVALVKEPESEIKYEMLSTLDSYEISTVNDFTRFLVLFKRLHIEPNQIIKAIFEFDKLLFLNLIGVGWFFSGVGMADSKVLIQAIDRTSMHYGFQYELKETNQVINSISFRNGNSSCDFNSINPFALKSIAYLSEYIKH